jgi:SagB-type dehydrogenase family enzyme
LKLCRFFGRITSTAFRIHLKTDDHEKKMRSFGSVSRREALEALGKAAAACTFWPVASNACIFPEGRAAKSRKEGPMNLPQPRVDGELSLERAIKNRRTIRSFSAARLSAAEFSQLLWAAQGITAEGAFKRAAPSAGALYPMDVYAVVGKGGVEGVEEGIYRYEPEGHSLSMVRQGDVREEVARASLGQTWMARAALNLVVTAEYRRSTVKYGERGIRYAMIEAGHIGQNIFLQAEALGLKAGIVGAFRDQEVIRVMRIPPSHEPLLIMPVGHGKPA